MRYLGLWEIAKKQQYIFKSNKLIEAVGASLIIKQITECFDEYSLKDENFIIKKGGKSLYNFCDLQSAQEFNRKFSFNILKNYPGIEIFMVIRQYDDENEDITDVIDNIYNLLEEKKRERKNSSYQIGFGMERVCTSTGLPASVKEREDNINNYYSRESKVKMDFARDEQENSFSDLLPEEYRDMPKELDRLVKEGSKSYIAVIHIDGNAMGNKFKQIKNHIKKSSDESMADFNKRYIDILKEFSEKVNEEYEDTFRYTMDIVHKNREKLKDVSNINEGYFPVRPLILAGDDITYISNGYIGIESAKIFLERLSKKNVNIKGIDLGTLYACAGVAIIKKGYPFVKGYNLAEDLCNSAKKALVEINNKNLSAIDFHIVQGEILGSVDDIRREEYSLDGKEGILTMRPLMVNNYEQWRNYDNFKTAYHLIQKAMKVKEIGRGKIKKLRTELRKGEDSVRHFVKFYSIDIKKYLKPVSGTSEYCFNNDEDDGRCMYLDAIEVLDIFKELDEGGK